MARISGIHGRSSIRYSVFLTFTVSAVLVVMLTVFFFYRRFSSQLEESMLSENQILISQVNQAMETYLREKMRISDAFYYNVIKNKNLDDEAVTEKLQLLYEANQSGEGPGDGAAGAAQAECQHHGAGVVCKVRSEDGGSAFF